MALLDGNRLVLGTCYYPEHWPQANWHEDLQRMLDAGIEVIRIAEFAWSKTEPTEGHFTFDFFDRFLDLCEEIGMKVIFCTPTATPPVWLTAKYPEVLNCDIHGHPYQHGGRRHTNYTSPVYRQLCARITKMLGEHYAKRRCVIGWQLDNEINCHRAEFFSEADSNGFRLFLENHYGTIDALNEAWGTVFWNQTYTDWSEVDLPRQTGSSSPNPHQMLDFIRFISSSANEFIALQSHLLQPYLKPGDFITTNGIFSNLDYHALTKNHLDFLTYDSYPNFAYALNEDLSNPDDLRDRKWSRKLSEVRAASPSFGIMEQQSGANGWNTGMEAPSPRPGQMSLWVMQSIAHGADFISFFRWRTCTIGTEIYWHGILDYSGRENRRIRELRALHRSLKPLQIVAGSTYAADVAVIKDYDNVWDSQIDAWHRRVEQVSQKAIFAAAQRSHTPLDYVYIDHASICQLRQYNVLFYPHASIMTEERTEMLTQYVTEGGTLILGCRSSYKDINGHCVTEHLPGMLARLSGADIPEYTFISPISQNVSIDWDGTEIEASVFIEMLEAQPSAKLEAVYTSDYFAGSGALTSHKVGKGMVYYYGTAFNEHAADVFLRKLRVASPLSQVIELPSNCELAVRRKTDKQFAFILNYSQDSEQICFKQPVINLSDQSTLLGYTTIPGYGTLVVELPTTTS